jgi:hypothetical protein
MNEGKNIKRHDNNIQFPSYRGSFIGHSVERVARYVPDLISFPHPYKPGEMMRKWIKRPIIHKFHWGVDKRWHCEVSYPTLNRDTSKGNKGNKGNSRKSKVTSNVTKETKPVPVRVKRVLRKRGSNKLKEIK